MLEPSTLKFRTLVWMTMKTIKTSTTASSNSLKSRFIGDAYPSWRAPESSPSHKHPAAPAQPDASFHPVTMEYEDTDGDKEGHIFPLAGISQTATVMCNEGTGARIYNSDEHGFQNPQGLWAQESMAIVAIGDSMTQGHCVEPGQSAMALIQNTYHNTLNLGFAGTGPISQFAILKEYAGRFKPKVVLWFYFEGNDLDEFQGYGREVFPVYGNYLEDKDFRQNLIDRQPEIDFHLKYEMDQRLKYELDQRLKRPRIQPSDEDDIGLSFKESSTAILMFYNLRRGISNTFNRFKEVNPGLDDRYHDFPLALELGKDYVESWGGRLYFVYLPSWERYRYPRHTGTLHLVKYRKSVLDLADSLDIRVIDVSEAFALQDDPLSLWPFRRFGHYNEEGYKVVADAVQKAIAVDLPDSQ